MSGHTLARAAKLAFGTGWSGAWVILGLWRLENTSLILAVGPFAAGLFVLMHVVADDLVPGASPTATGFMKLTVALVFFGWVPLVFRSLWTGIPI